MCIVGAVILSSYSLSTHSVRMSNILKVLLWFYFQAIAATSASMPTLTRLDNLPEPRDSYAQ